ncbi:hypothetical protein HPB50_002665 [Hyalomma asiaticum]|uniref:Uncharacterized protein n=1 Tax=Hyalomma asiaticum TaxID=266040 RepID=A0ACB7SIK9_HYAAI|nr:hypothetical protein HPB50_002665 [Hyalomma asiaticum]
MEEQPQATPGPSAATKGETADATAVPSEGTADYPPRMDKVRKLSDSEGDNPPVAHSLPKRHTTLCAGPTGSTTTRRLFGVNQTENRTDAPPVDLGATAVVVIPENALGDPKAPAVCSQKTLTNAEWLGQAHQESQPSSTDTEMLDRKPKMTLGHYIYLHPAAEPMLPRASLPSAELGSGYAGQNVTTPPNGSPVSAMVVEPEPIEMSVAASIKNETSLDTEGCPTLRNPSTALPPAVIYARIPEATYSSFHERPSSRRCWTAQETADFYRALQTFGTDFDLMRTAFPNRTHKNLKNKFKKEERENRNLVHKIITHPTKLNLEDFKDESSEPKGP